MSTLPISLLCRLYNLIDLVFLETFPLTACYLPTTRGQRGVLPGHEAAVFSLDAGILRLHLLGENEIVSYVLHHGIADANAETVTIYASGLEKVPQGEDPQAYLEAFLQRLDLVKS